MFTEQELQQLRLNVVSIIRHVGRELVSHQSSVKEVFTNRKDFVTSADEMSHEFIVGELQKLTPGVRIYSEEDGVDLSETNDWIWIVDPVDGTINYFHGLPEWGVSIALVKDKQTQLGAVYLPGAKILLARINDAKSCGKKTVRNDKNLSQAQIWTDHIKGPPEPVIDIFGKLIRHTLCPQIRLCCTASMLAVALGQIAGYIHPDPKPEDFAAVALIVEKAGGRITDLQGNDWNLFSKSIVATNGLLHDQLLSILNS